MGLVLMAVLLAAPPALAQASPGPDAAPSGPSPDPVPAAARAVTASPAPVAVTRAVTPSAPVVTTRATPVSRPVVPTTTVAVRPAVPSTPAVAPRRTPARRTIVKRRTHPRPKPARAPAPPILEPPSYTTARPILRVKRLVAAAERTGLDRGLLAAAAGALALLALSSASLLVLTRRLKREVRAA